MFWAEQLYWCMLLLFFKTGPSRSSASSSRSRSNGILFHAVLLWLSHNFIIIMLSLFWPLSLKFSIMFLFVHRRLGSSNTGIMNVYCFYFQNEIIRGQPQVQCCDTYDIFSIQFALLCSFSITAVIWFTTYSMYLVINTEELRLGYTLLHSGQ